jgi:hypothetical protein
MGNSYQIDETYQINDYTVDNNGIGTVSEAYAAKAAGTKIYSIGFGTGEQRQRVRHAEFGRQRRLLLRLCEASATAIDNVFSQIVTEIEDTIQPGTGASVTDPMGEKVDLVSGDTTYAITASSGTATPSADGKTLNWDIGALTAGTYTLTYYVRLNSVQAGEQYFQDE